MFATTFLLADRCPVLVRPIQPEDRALLQDGLARLSPGSRYRRFLSVRDDFTERELDYLTKVDHHDHEALLAFDALTGEGIGVARYVRTGRRTAEPAVTVADAWQGRGLGSRLAHLLALRAREAGIRSFGASTLPSNAAAARMLAGLGPTWSSVSSGHLQLATDLPSRRALRRRIRALQGSPPVTRRWRGWAAPPPIAGRRQPSTAPA